MKVKIFSLNDGLTEYNDVISIKLVSKDYNLLILKDYIPIIGEVDGSIELKYQDNNLLMENVFAYYMNQDNVFNIIIKEK